MLKPKQILFPFISVLFGLFLSFLILELFCRVLPVRDSLMMLPVHATNPIVRFKPNRVITWSSGATFAIVTSKHINNYGFLSDQDYFPTEESPLLAIIGDSYVEAAQVDTRNTMHGILSQETVGKGRVYCFGASGSPLSTYLAYAKYATQEFNATALVFIIVGNDFDESLLEYKSAPGFHYFAASAEGLSFVRKDYQPTLLKRLARQSALIRYLALNMQLRWQSIESLFGKPVGEAAFVGNTRAAFDEERMSKSRRVVDRFLAELPTQTGLGSDRILFVLDGMRPQLYEAKTLAAADGSYFDVMRDYFMEVAAKKEFAVIDMQPRFVEKYKAEGVRFEFRSDAHWNEAGHRLVAEAIRESAVYRSVFER